MMPTWVSLHTWLRCQLLTTMATEVVIMTTPSATRGFEVGIVTSPF